MTRDKILIFLHHQRCGGTTFREITKQIHVVPYRTLTVDKLIDKAVAVNPPCIEVEPGLYFDTKYDFDYCTTIRDPIDRLLSFVELHSRKGIIKLPGRDGIKTNDEFWVSGIKYLESLRQCNVFIRSISMKIRSTLTAEDVGLAMTRLSNMPILAFHKKTFPEDISVFLNVLGLTQRKPVDVYMKGSDEFVDAIPSWVRPMLENLNMHDIQLWRWLNSVTNSNNIYIPN